MATHSLRPPAESGRTLARKRRILAFGVALAMLIVAALVLLFAN